MNQVIIKIFDDNSKNQNLIATSIMNSKANEILNNHKNNKTLLPRLYCHFAIADELCKQKGLESAPDYSFSHEGKPFFSQFLDFNFSLSHTKNASAVIFSKNKVGIDIENHHDIPEKLINRVCNNSEKNYISSSHNPRKAFFDLWCLKESFTKAISSTILSTINNTYFTIEDDIKIHYKDECPEEKHNYNLDNLKFEIKKTNDNYSCAICELAV